MATGHRMPRPSAPTARTARQRPPGVDGIINIDKPVGITTMDVVRRIKRVSSQKRVGHGGTLDPFASGVVAVCLGQATRMMEYLIEGTREYRALVVFGVETDTYDSDGEVTRTIDPSALTLPEIEGALARFQGTFDQVPPMYSALKQKGKRLYDLARAGIEVERSPRRVEVTRLEMLDWSPPGLTIELTCGRGFYVRSLAYDLGQVLGCGGHLKTLVRLRSGPFTISEAMSLPEAEERLAQDGWCRWLNAPDVVVRHLRAAVVGERVEKMIRNGRALPSGVRVPPTRPGELCRVYSNEGRFVGIISFSAAKGQWEPDRVFPER